MDQLRAFAQHEFKLAKPHSGTSLRAHYESIKRQTGKTPRQLIGPPRPAGSDMLWRMFSELSGTRRWTDMGQPCAIAFSEMKAYSQVNKYEIGLNEIAMLRMLDNEFRTIMATKNQQDADDDWSKD